MQLSLKASTRVAAASARVARVAPSSRVGVAIRRPVAVRAESDSSSTDDFSAKAQEYVKTVTENLQSTWEGTADAEKPAIVAILVAVSVAQIAIGAVMDKVDRLPFFGDLFELIGVAVVGAYAYRYFSDPAERASAAEVVDTIVIKVKGSK
ncbi:hypothetical protein FOA52_007967 [Chlamydomonas sp. UWO 241]|nr:hypothetical protein FOA52_007967 [Chlamydomonas sp. UWO 241]